MTVSFHKYGNMFFPGTGSIYDLGQHTGRYYAVNVPLQQGIDDDDYLALFRPIIGHVVDNFSPEAIVLQCGADSLGCDRLGCFNLSSTVLSYTFRSSPLTCHLCYKNVFIEYLPFFEPEFTLRPELPKRAENLNTKDFLTAIRQEVIENLRQVKGAPSVQMTAIPDDLIDKEIALNTPEVGENERSRDHEDMNTTYGGYMDSIS
uniref:Hist_deacetyl domain-containing protein n=1 Tax=Heterorhabditis bacteriophora TaxID=37862 RepID=A0A1I7WXN9_HETBA